MMTVLKNDTDTYYDDYEYNTACNNFNNEIVFFGYFLIILIGRRGVYFIGANDWDFFASDINFIISVIEVGWL